MGLRHRLGPGSRLCVGNGKDFIFRHKYMQRLTIEQVLTTWILKRYNHEVQTSEMFSTAGRTVKSGLVASAVVSSWTVRPAPSR